MSFLQNSCSNTLGKTRIGACISKPANREAGANSFGISGNCTIEFADFAIEIPKEAKAGLLTNNAPLRFICRIDAHAKERRVHIIEQTSLSKCGCNGRFA